MLLVNPGGGSATQIIRSADRSASLPDRAAPAPHAVDYSRSTASAWVASTALLRVHTSPCLISGAFDRAVGYPHVSRSARNVSTRPWRSSISKYSSRDMEGLCRLVRCSGDLLVRHLAAWAKSDALTFRANGCTISRSVIIKILRNPFYTGRFVWNGKLYRGPHKPLVSFKLWEKVQSIMTNWMRRNGPRVNGEAADSNSH